MNPLAVLLPALYAALTTPALSQGGAAVPVHQHLLVAEAGHYVLISQPTDTDLGGATGCRRFACTVLLDVVTQFADRRVSSVPAEAIVSQVNERLRGRRLNGLLAGWEAGPGELVLSTQLEELEGELLAVRRLLRYRWELYYNL